MTDQLTPDTGFHSQRRRLWLKVMTSNLWRRAGMALGLFLIVFGSRVALVQEFASPAPYYDQWNAEAELLYPAWIENRLDWGTLVARHNEHRIFLTRLLSLALLEANHLWDPILQMVVNAALHAGLAVILFLMLCRVVGRRAVGRSDLGCLMATLLFTAVPFDHENLLAGFQSQFELMIMFGLAAIWVIAGAERLWGLRWWLGWGVLLLGVGTMAGGFFPAVALAGVFFFQAILVTGNRRSSLLAAGMLFSFGVICLALHLPASGNRHSVPAILTGFFTFLSWPLGLGGWGWLVLYLPSLAAAFGLLRGRLTLTAPVRITLGLTFWVLTHAAAIAVSRSEFVLSSRYFSIGACGLAANFLWCCLLIGTIPPKKWAGEAGMRWALSCWFLVAGSAVLCDFHQNRVPEIHWLSDSKAAHVDHLERYLANGDDSKLGRQKDIPLPTFESATSLKEILSSPSLRFILPYQIKRGLAAEQKQSSAAFLESAGVVPETEVAPLRPYWGTFGAEGAGAMGEMLLQFNEKMPSPWVEIWLAGAPSPKGSSLVIQDIHGRRKMRLFPEGRPGKEWQRILVKVPYHPFQILAADRFNDRWFAFTAPRSVGTLELQKSWLLDHGWMLAGFGIFLLGVIAIHQSQGTLPQDLKPLDSRAR